MGSSDQRAMRHMKLPERGTLRVTGVHEGHSHSRISGVITSPGIRPTRVEHKIDERGRVTNGQDLPVLVDRADPSRFVILWDEAGNAAGAPPSFQYGSGADVFFGPEGQPYPAALPPDTAARVEAALEQAFSQRGRQMPPGMAARVEQALDRALGQAGLQGEGISEAISQALGRAAGQPYSAPGGPPYRQGSAQPFGPTAGPSYGQGGAQPFDPTAGPSYGQGGAQPYGQEATGFPQVSWTDQEASGASPQGGFSPAQPAHFPAGGGEPASAIVLAAQDAAPGPGFAAAGGAVDLTLEVRRADGSVYTARTTLSVPTPEARAAVATPGARLSVLIDPNNPARVQVDPYGRY